MVHVLWLQYRCINEPLGLKLEQISLHKTEDSMFQSKAR